MEDQKRVIEGILLLKLAYKGARKRLHQMGKRPKIFVA